MNKLKKQVSFGAVYLSPEHPEMEIIRRISVAADSIGAKFYLLDQRGFCLDSGKRISHELDFVLIFDPVYSLYLDCFCYHVSWFCYGLLPLSLYLSYNKLSYGCDDFLFFPSSDIKNLASVVADNIYRTSLNENYLYPSVPLQYVVKPKKFCGIDCEGYKLFYVGVNQEGDSDSVSSMRYGELFSILDGSGKVCFYGPEVICGKQNWKNFKSYCGEIPFDGYSVVSKANEKGICLVIQHDLHNIWGMVTNRLFEGCAAGCLVIADKLDFIIENFGDSVFYLDAVDRSPDYMAKQVIDIVDWANNNPKKAYDMAKKSQSIFLQKFELSKVLYNICSSHEKRSKELFDASLLETKDRYVDVILRVYDENCFSNQVEDVLGQDYPHINVVIIVTEPLTKNQEKLINKLKSKLSVKIKICIESKTGFINVKSSLFYAKELIESDFFVFSMPFQRWKKNHIRCTLTKLLEDSNCFLSYSGAFSRSRTKDEDGVLLSCGCIDNFQNKLLSFFDKVTPNSSYMSSQIQKELLMSSVVFRSDILELISIQALSGLHQCEHIALALVALANNKLVVSSGKVAVFIFGQLREDIIFDEKICYNKRLFKEKIFEYKTYNTPHQQLLDYLYTNSKIQMFLSKNNFLSSGDFCSYNLGFEEEVANLKQLMSDWRLRIKKIVKMLVYTAIFFFLTIIIVIALYVLFW